MEILHDAEMRRYARHLALPEIGLSGQKKLKASRILIIGTGGLGSPVALYLAAAGIGTIGLMDFDTIDVSNLQRQILFTEGSVGKSKISEAKERLHSLNSQIKVNVHEEKLTSENALQIFKNYDLIIDGSDNFPTRYLVNDACVLSGLPYIYGSVFRFWGQCSVFATKDGPCYRCLYPEPPDPESIPSCNDDGVLGVLPGVIGMFMATEAIKVLLGIGKTLAGRLMTYDALEMKFAEYIVAKNNGCPVCRKNPSITTLIDYEEFCNGSAIHNPEINVEEYAQYRIAHDHILLDVREPYEFDIANLGGILIPLSELASRIEELPKEKEIIVLCHHGIRSRRGTSFLKAQGFKKVRNLTGGIKAWSERIDPTVQKY